MNVFSYTFNVAGVTFKNRQRYIYYIIQNPNAYLMFHREKTNEFDKNAIRVIAKVPDGKCVTLGYVPKDIAAKIAPLVDKNYDISAKGYTITGGKYYNRGVKVNITVYPKRQKMKNIFKEENQNVKA